MTCCRQSLIFPLDTCGTKPSIKQLSCKTIIVVTGICALKFKFLKSARSDISGLPEGLESRENGENKFC